MKLIALTAAVTAASIGWWTYKTIREMDYTLIAAGSAPCDFHGCTTPGTHRHVTNGVIHFDRSI